MSRLCKIKSSDKITSKITWNELWNEAVALSTRAKKNESIASETLTINLVKNIVSFLHDSRNLLTSQDALDILQNAMVTLQDTRRVCSAEGVILLVSFFSTRR